MAGLLNAVQLRVSETDVEAIEFEEGIMVEICDWSDRHKIINEIMDMIFFIVYKFFATNKP